MEPKQKNIVQGKIAGGGSKFETTKCRMTDVSEFQNCEY